MAKKRGRDPLGAEEKRKFNRSNFKKLLGVFKYVLPYKGLFVAGMLCLFFSSITLLAFPYFAGKLLDVAGGEPWPYLSTINQIALVLIGILLVQSFFSFLRVYLFAQVSERSMADIRLAVYSKMVVLPVKFFDSRRVGELISRITSDVSMLQDTFSVTLAELFRQTATLIIGTTVIFVIAPKLTVFMLVTFPVLVIAALFFGRFIRTLSKKTQDKLADANVVVEETLQSVNTVKAFTNEKFEISRYGKALHEVVAIALKTAKYRGAFISFVIFALFGGIVGVMWYGAVLVQDGVMTVGDLLSFVLYTTFIGGSIAGLGDIYGQVQRAIGASERVLEIIHEQGEASGDYKQNIRLKGNIEFDNVSFAYPARKKVSVLNGLSLHIHPGQKIALVGPSGAGKSTIIQLLMRFYAISQGRLRVDGQDINNYDLSTYRSNVGIVPQEVILFGGTIKENIAYAKPNATQQEIEEAAKKANAYDFIMKFPEGFETIVGDRGIKLSGGQRQRIAIARAILKDPAILILDEATSSLDAESEVLVQQALDELMKNRTTIIIAHRLATIRKVDNIFVIKNGEIVETGTHEELSEYEEGIYSYLLRLQFQLT
ncbi:HlyB/MsbA family ABC transporter [Fulvivirga imtechensis AK7]|uniref:HlyB/MsbA family ABC transporter n=1 Tax=Fulvivirga imtechensis AK7 TaxID=1237149 RepID=L8JLI4_9BACT|nr:ABC transporter transmembrane domain-containing protein [Fulvivirga imtechensis]ELR69776.1 HlyB/MsbA family ABC transporter [Fulvivirga imtechensis AK7]